MLINLKIPFLILISGILFILLFVGGPHYHSPRSFQHAWDLGHIVCFFVWTLTYLSLAKNNRQTAFLKQCIYVIGIAFSAAILIEWVQKFFNRSADAGDVMKGLLGCLLALAFFCPSPTKLSKGFLRSLQLIIVFIVAFESYPLTSAFIDESIAGFQFPILSDFETPFEIQRWIGNSKREIVHDIALHGRSSLKASLNTTKYSGATISHCPEDWREHRFLEFSIFNASPRVLKITCTVQDRMPTMKPQGYHDRFNRRFPLAPGWNTIRIATNEIQHAPKDRKMDLADIQRIDFFATRLTHPETIYIDYVRLVP